MSLKIYLSIISTLLISGVLYFNLKQPKQVYTPLIKSRTIPFNSFATAGVNAIALTQKMDVAEKDEEISTVSIEYSFPIELSEPLQYRWKLGQDVILVEGALQGKTESGIVRANELQTLTIKVRGFSKQRNHHISFEIFGQANRRPLQSKTIIASLPEETFENIVQNVERIKREE